MVTDTATTSKSVSAGMREANEAREKYTKAAALGEISFEELTHMSKLESYKALGRIRLVNILAGKPGWSMSTSIEALRHAGLDTKDTIQSIRRNPSKVETFSIIMTKAKAGQWRERPPMPAGWPWAGKIEIVAEACGVPMSDDYIAVLEAAGQIDLSTGEITDEIVENKEELPLRPRNAGKDFSEDDFDVFFGEEE